MHQQVTRFKSLHLGSPPGGTRIKRMRRKIQSHFSDTGSALLEVFLYDSVISCDFWFKIQVPKIDESTEVHMFLSTLNRQRQSPEPFMVTGGLHCGGSLKSKEPCPNMQLKTCWSGVYHHHRRRGRHNHHNHHHHHHHHHHHLLHHHHHRHRHRHRQKYRHHHHHQDHPAGNPNCTSMTITNTSPRQYHHRRK